MQKTYKLVDAVSENEAAFALRLMLGGGYAWLDYLRDCRRGKHDLKMKVAFVKNRQHFYLMASLNDLVNRFKQKFPKWRGSATPLTVAGRLRVK